MKKELTRTGAYWLSFLFSILLFLIVCWSAVFQDTTAYWVESIGYFCELQPKVEKILLGYS